VQARPLVSIVLPTYNRAGLLAEAVASVRAQTFSNWELLVVDDGSTDGSAGALPDDPRVKLVRREHSGNIAAVRNAGLDAAAGDYIGFLDSDDRWHARKLERQVERLARSPEAGWCHGEAGLIDAAGNPVPMRAGVPWRPREGRFIEDVLTTEASIALQTVLVRRALALAVRFDERIPTVDDYDFIVQLAIGAPAVAVDGGIVAETRVHDARTTNARYDHGLGAAMAYRKAFRQVQGWRLKGVCVRQGLSLLRHHLANARARGELSPALRRAYASLVSLRQ
jgi:glycosyltransferase involved in cell wall biosynthesis